MRTFNKEQAVAIQHKKGPMLVLAGAGAGKTTVLTYRIYNLIVKRNVKPQNILVLTFTKAAASEMEGRFQKLIQKKVNVRFGTFHSVFLKILIDNTEYEYSDIISPQQQQMIIEQAAYNLNFYLGSGDEITERVNEILRNIDLIKNHKVKGRSCIKYSGEMSLETIESFYEAYEEYMKQNHLIDFSDMLLLTYNLFMSNEEVLEHYRDYYRYILVDEYQDTNPIQNAVLFLLAHPRNNIFCVGDDDQSIYGFRGADPAVMFEFPKKFQDTKIIQLSINYRCNERIVAASNRLITYNQRRYKKNIRAVNGGNDVVIKEFDDQKKEFLYVEEQILHTNIPYDENACLFRTKHGIEHFAANLVKREIPFYSTESIRNIFDHFIAKDLLSYIECAAGNEEGLYRILNKPKRYIEKKHVKPGITLEELSKVYQNKDYVLERIQILKDDLQSMSGKHIKDILDYIFEKIGYRKYLKDFGTYCKLNDRQKEELFGTAKQIIEFCGSFKTIEQMKKGIEKYTDNINHASKRKGENRKGKVILSTIHAAKGLEYQQVFICDVNQKNLPFEKRGEHCDIEEERRLMYVAATRAKNFLHVLYLKNEESIFIQQMQRGQEDFCPGNRVAHKIFGQGTINEITYPYITVQFDNSKVRFDLEYAITHKILSLIIEE